MNKRLLLFILGIGLASLVFADLGFYVSFNSHEHLKVFTSQYISDKSPTPSFWDMLIMLSSFEPNRQEFFIFGNISKGENVDIENGIWNTKKNALGMGYGKVLTLPISLRKFDVELRLDFSAGPFLNVFLSNQYTHVGGQLTSEVDDAGIFNNIQYGLYSTVRLRLVHFKKYFNSLAANLGLHFFMPFSNHEFNSDTVARYHLFKTFAF
ncbi:MAG: hypothetical protein NTZ12_11710, partial [Candidatus Aminicenantes bacterium]|nr:hypothetical protein [Candidatus Aminicenantes bacterium]